MVYLIIYIRIIAIHDPPHCAPAPAGCSGTQRNLHSHALLRAHAGRSRHLHPQLHLHRPLHPRLRIRSRRPLQQLQPQRLRARQLHVRHHSRLRLLRHSLLAHHQLIRHPPHLPQYLPSTPRCRNSPQPHGTPPKIQFQIPNPWGAGSETISLTIFDSGGNNLTLKQSYNQAYAASPLNSCQWSSSSGVNGAVSTRTISFIPSVPLIQTSYLQVTIPVWIGNSTSNLVSGSLACSSISVR
jgi:hypothetical protein